jgi:hypothetical protein
LLRDIVIPYTLSESNRKIIGLAPYLGFGYGKSQLI